MTKGKKILAMLVVIIFSICLVQNSFVASAEEADNSTTYIKVRYNREDGNYKGWDIWTWDENNGGHAEVFDGVDSQGVYKLLARPKSAGEIGIIVRTESWDKCDPNDVKINAGDGDCEVVFTDSTKSSKVQEPQSEFKDVEEIGRAHV